MILPNNKDRELKIIKKYRWASNDKLKLILERKENNLKRLLRIQSINKRYDLDRPLTRGQNILHCLQESILEIKAELNRRNKQR